MEVGGFLALWVIGYGIIQASAPTLLRRSHHGRGPTGNTAKVWVFGLFLIPLLIASGLSLNIQPQFVLITGLTIFGVVFAINSAVHSYLIVAWSSHENVSMKVGFYYMANAAGRLLGTLFSGLIYQTQGLIGCLIWSSVLILLAGVFSLKLPKYANG